MESLKDCWELGKEFLLLDGKNWIKVECTLRNVMYRHLDKTNELKEFLNFYNDTQLKAFTIRDINAGIYNNCQSCNLDYLIKEINN